MPEYLVQKKIKQYLCTLNLAILTEKAVSENMKKTRDNYTFLTHAPVHRVVFTMAIPTIISMLSTSMYNLADTYFVGSINTQRGREGEENGCYGLRAEFSYGSHHRRFRTNIPYTALHSFGFNTYHPTLYRALSGHHPAGCSFYDYIINAQ